MAQNDSTSRPCRGDDLLLAALAAGQSQRKAAARAGCGLKKVGRRLADPAFRKRLDSLRELVLDRTMGQLVRGAAKAAHKLVSLVDSEDEKIALEASKSLLTQVLKVREELPMARRIEDLERIVEQAKNT
jgi:hypothetical protein